VVNKLEGYAGRGGLKRKVREFYDLQSEGSGQARSQKEKLEERTGEQRGEKKPRWKGNQKGKKITG